MYHHICYFLELKKYEKSLFSWLKVGFVCLSVKAVREATTSSMLYRKLVSNFDSLFLACRGQYILFAKGQIEKGIVQFEKYIFRNFHQWINFSNILSQQTDSLFIPHSRCLSLNHLKKYLVCGAKLKMNKAPFIYLVNFHF